MKLAIRSGAVILAASLTAGCVGNGGAPSTAAQVQKLVFKGMAPAK